MSTVTAGDVVFVGDSMSFDAIDVCDCDAVVVAEAAAAAGAAVVSFVGAIVFDVVVAFAIDDADVDDDEDDDDADVDDDEDDDDAFVDDTLIKSPFDWYKLRSLDAKFVIESIKK